MDAVVPGPDGEAAALDHDAAGGIVVVVLRVEPVAPGLQDVYAVIGADAVVGLQGGVGGGDVPGAPGELQIVVGADAVCGGAHGHGAQAVQHQIVPGVDHGVLVAAENAADSEGILAALGGGEEDLVGVLHQDAGLIRVHDAQAFQHQLDLVLVPGVHHHLGLPGAAAQDVDSGFGEGHRIPVGHGDGGGLAQIRGLAEIPIREQVLRFGGDRRGSRRRGGDPSRGDGGSGLGRGRRGRGGGGMAGDHGPAAGEQDGRRQDQSGQASRKDFLLHWIVLSFRKNYN